MDNYATGIDHIELQLRSLRSRSITLVTTGASDKFAIVTASAQL